MTWKLFHDQSLWAEQMKAKYSINEHFFEVDCAKYDSWAVYFAIATNSGKEFDGKWVMTQEVISGLTIGVQMIILLHCSPSISPKLILPLWSRNLLPMQKNGMF